jgi:hypothetical protein
MFADILGKVFGNLTWWTVPILFAALLMFASLQSGFIESNLKSGRFGFRKPYKRINDTFFAVLPAVSIVFGGRLFYILLDTGLISLIHVIFSGSGAPPNVADIIFVVIVQIFLFLLFALLFSAAALFVPCSLILGYPARESASYAIRLFRDIWLKFFTAALIPVLIGFVPITILALYEVNWLIQAGVNTLFYLFAGHYYGCLAFTAFYELTGTERRDNLRGFHNIKSR